MGKYREINPSEKELPDLKEVREKSLEKRDLTYLGKNTVLQLVTCIVCSLSKACFYAL